MNIGDLNSKITIETAVLATDSTTGERTTTWQTLAIVWATVTYPSAEFSASENNSAGRLTAYTPVNFTIYYRTDITVKQRILWGGSYYAITRINIGGVRKEWLKLVTEKLN